MKIYLAASYNRRIVTRSYRDALEKKGHRVTSRWLDCHGGAAPANYTATQLSDITPTNAMSFAKETLEDIDAAELVVVFTQDPSTTGGRHVEFGYALGKGKNIVIIGPIENIFQYGDAVNLYPTWTAFHLELQRAGEE